MLAEKLQLKQGQTIAVADVPAGIELDVPRASGVEQAEGLLVFVPARDRFGPAVPKLQAVAARGGLAWIAYPKAGKLGTDLNRDVLREALAADGLDTVRQIAIDDTWSALRVKAAAS
jgi:hypothetical protein